MHRTSSSNACKGFPEEILLELGLNHRDMPRFHTAADSNFVMFRNSLLMTVGDVSKRCWWMTRELHIFAGLIVYPPSH